jgi:hypothetical protein
MKATLVFLGLMASLGVVAARQDHRHLGKIAWEHDPATGLAKAKSENKAALLYFTAEW